MPAQRGRDLLLKVDDGAAGLVTIGGLRTRQIAFNTQTVDVTHADSVGRWRELLAGAGVRRASISGAGIFRDEASDLRLRAIFFAGEIRDWQIVIPDFGTVSGPFQIASLEYRGEHDGEVTFDLALESAGNLIFTTAP
jgi:TP901-1 family phage major tail protein